MSLVNRLGNTDVPCFTRLGSEPDGRVGRTKPVVVPPLDHFEEEAVIKGTGVDLEEFAVAITIIEDLVVAQALGHLWSKVIPGFEIVIVIGWDMQEIQTIGPHGLNTGEDIMRLKRYMLDTGPKEFSEEAS